MGRVSLTKRIEFSASHRYHNEAWDDARNREVFGACNIPPGHGHNYLLEVTVSGEVPGETGMVVNLYDLKQVLKQVLVEFDHKHLNLDTPYFKDRIPTTENLAGVLWKRLAAYQEIGCLEKIRLFESEDLWVDLRASDLTEALEVRHCRLTRRYAFSAAHDLSSRNRTLYGKCGTHGIHGHNYVLHVTVGGAVQAGTGMVVDLRALDQVVADAILERFEGRNLNEDPVFSTIPPTGQSLARVIWQQLVPSIPGARLEQVGLLESEETQYEYSTEQL